MNSRAEVMAVVASQCNSYDGLLHLPTNQAAMTVFSMFRKASYDGLYHLSEGLGEARVHTSQVQPGSDAHRHSGLSRNMGTSSNIRLNLT